MDIKTLAETPPWDWPENAAKTIHETLTHPKSDLADRIIAAQLAGDIVVINNHLASDLLAIVRSAGEPDNLRATAALALGPVLEQSFIDEFEDSEDPPISESKFREIQDTLHAQFNAPGLSKELRRKILEASVRAPEPWHPDAIRTAYSSGDSEWVLTAVFAMRYIPGFSDQILEALRSDDPLIRYEAVHGASNLGLDGAWPTIVALITNPRTPKDLLLAAIEAAPNIRPEEAGPLVVDLTNSDDEEIVEAADEAMAMAEAALSAEEEDEDDEDEDDETEGNWVN